MTGPSSATADLVLRMLGLRDDAEHVIAGGQGISVLVERA